MVNLEPLIYLRGERHELQNKGGGGSAKDPWIDVDATGLRAQLLSGLEQSQDLLGSLPPQIRQVGVPLRVTLRPQAHAKSNRPTHFLTSSGAQPIAAGRPGELFARVREAEIASLKKAISEGSTKGALYAISTIEEISVFDPASAFGVDGRPGLLQLVESVRDSRRLLRLDLFPWIHGDTLWSNGETLKQHLRSLGLAVRGALGKPTSESLYVSPGPTVDLAEVLNLYGIRHASAEPTYSHWREVGPQSMAIVGTVTDDLRDLLSKDRQALVGVLDSGISSPTLEPFVQARESYDVGGDFNPEHGTFVAGLILGGRELNAQEDCFGDDTALIVDGQVLPSSPIGELELLERISETVRKYPAVKVWNCSFARLDELNPLEYSLFASELDQLASELAILFVQAAGNYGLAPARTWPPRETLADGISSPADAVNSLVVGSLSHRGGRTAIGQPASYSRRGPSFGGQTKPDVSYWSGDFGPAGESPHSGIRSIVPGDHIAEGVGTSFATPLVSAIAANVWAELDGLRAVVPTPALVKGLVMHGASVSSHNLVGSHKNYYGAGVPLSGARSLFEDPGSFTTVHEVTLRSKISWVRAPYPVPACLFTPDGKLRAEIFMTVCYGPVIERAFGEEAVRTSIDASFGVIQREGSKLKIIGKVPEEKVAWESDLVSAGKWSPVRTHYVRFPQGTSGDEWGLKLSLTEREDSPDGVEQQVYVFLTMRGVEEGLPVHAEGLRQIQRLSLWSTPLSQRTSIDVEI
jgi:subtilisin family serine protease